MDKVDVRGGPEIGTVDVSAREDRHLLNADAAAGLLVLVDLLPTSETFHSCPLLPQEQGLKLVSE